MLLQMIPEVSVNVWKMLSSRGTIQPSLHLSHGSKCLCLHSTKCYCGGVSEGVTTTLPVKFRMALWSISKSRQNFPSPYSPMYYSSALRGGAAHWRWPWPEAGWIEEYLSTP